MEMKKLDPFEWPLFYLLLATFVAGAVIASSRYNQRVAAIPKQYPVVAVCR